MRSILVRFIRPFIFLVAAVLLFCIDVINSQAAGIVIPANCTLDIASCSMTVSGDVTNAGTLRASAGLITLSGHWINSGTFTSGTGTVTFNATSGVQNLNTGGLAHAFYNLTHNGAGTVLLLTNVLDINNTFTNSAGTFDASSLNITVGKNWSNTATFTPGLNTVTLDGTSQTVSGSTTFYNLYKVTGSTDTLTFSADGADETTVTHLLTLKGAASNLLGIQKSGANSQSKQNLQAGGAQSIRYLDVHDSIATGLTLVAGSTSTNGGNTTNWSFGNSTITWDGTESTDWDDPFNWDLGVVPAPGDTAVIPPIAGGVLYQPTFATAVNVGYLTIQASATVTLNAVNLTVTNTLSNLGTVILKGSETVEIATIDSDSGTFRYDGTGAATTFNPRITDPTSHAVLTNEFYNLTINDTTNLGTFRRTANLNVLGALTVSGGNFDISTNANALAVTGNIAVTAGTLTATGGTIDVNGGVSITSTGTLVAPSATTNTAFTVAGSWTKDGTGTFTHSSGKVTLDGTSQAMSGSTTFYRLRKVTSAGTLTLQAASTQTVTNDLTLSGATGAGNLLNIVSSSSPTQAKITLQSGVSATQNIAYVDVINNDASGGLELVARNGSNNGGNNINWVFGGTTITWNGAISTDWDTAGNWDKGLVPGSLDTAVIPTTASTTNRYPVLATDVTVTNLTLSNAVSTLSLNGKNLDVTGTLSNLGTMSLTGPETVEITTTDTDSGTFTYTGTGAAGPYTVQITDPISHAVLTNEYYNLTIADTSGVGTFRRAASVNVAGALTVSGGTFDISTNSNALAVTGNLTVSGGTLTANNGTIDANGSVVISSGTLNAPASTANTAFTVQGDFTHSGGTFTHDSGKVTLDGTNQAMNGNTTFYRLRKVPSAASTLTLQAAMTQTVTNDLTLGVAGTLLTMVSTSSTPAKISLSAGGTQSINYVDVINNDASGGVTLVARSSSINSGGNTNWYFGAATVTWTGTTSTSWDVATNWDLGLVPIAVDTAIIADTSAGSTRLPALATNTTIYNLTLQAASTLTLGGLNLTVSNILSNAGTIIPQGTETVEITTMDIDSGTFSYVGTGGAGPFTIQITDPTSHAVLTNGFYNLTIADASGAGTFVPGMNLNVAGNLTGTGGTLNISTGSRTLTVDGNIAFTNATLTATNGNIDANASVSIAGTGVLTAPTTAKTFTVAGDFGVASTATFTNSSGQVTLDTTGTATISGSNTFYDLTSTAAGKLIKFTAGSTQTVTHTLTLLGTRANAITLNSTVNGTAWNMTFPNSGQTVGMLTVKDGYANTNTVTCYNCTDGGGNNANWIFAALSITAPGDDRTVGQGPTIIGVSTPNTNVRVKGKNVSGTEVIVATATTDANGNFRVTLGQDLDADGTTTVATGVLLRVSTAAYDNYLVPYILNLFSVEVPGYQNDLTVVASPTTAQVPQIVTLEDGARITVTNPTLTGTGKASEVVTVVASDVSGNLLLSTVGTGSTDGSGNYSITLTTPLVKSTNFVSVTVDNVASAIFTYHLTDPFGVVFDSSNNDLMQNAIVSIYRASDNQLAQPSSCDSLGNITTLRDLDCDDTNPYTTAADGFYSFIAADGNYYIVVNETNYTYPSVLTTFPSGRTVVTGSKGEVFAVASVIIEMDHPVDGAASLLRIEKDANKGEVRVGDVVTYTVTIRNISTVQVVKASYLKDNIPPGFKYISDRVLLDGAVISNPTGNRPLLFNLGTVPTSTTKILRYQLVVGSGVVPGTYENVAHAVYSSGLVISNTARESVLVVRDSLFDLGTVVGKVFYDLNDNGIQDAPKYDPTQGTTIVEKAVPNVQIAMEDGTVITSDREGKFSVPGILPGRHILRMDERTLPPGSYLTTDKAVIVDITQGMIAKVNFGVNLDHEQVLGRDAVFFNEKIALVQDRDRPIPVLNAAMFGLSLSESATLENSNAPQANVQHSEELVMFNGTLVRPAEFRIFTNYSSFVERFNLDIIDRDTKRLVKRFEGTRFNMYDPIFWDGRGDDDKLIQAERQYAYVLSVIDEKSYRDSTHEKPIAVRVIDAEDEFKKEKVRDEDKEVVKLKAEVYREWVAAESLVNGLDRQNIPVGGETVRIDRQGQAVKTVRVLKDGVLFAEVPIDQHYGLTPQELMTSGMTSPDGPDNIELVLPNGDYTLELVNAQGAIPAAADDGSSEPLVAPVAREVGITSAAGAMGAVALERYSRPLRVGDNYLMFVGMGDGKVGYTFNRGQVESVAAEDKYQSGFWKEGQAAYYLKGKILGKYLVTSSFDMNREQKALYRKLDPNSYYPIYGDQSSINYDATNTQGPLYLLVEWDKSSAIWGNYAVDFGGTEFAGFSRSYYGGKLDYQSLATNSYGDARTKVVLFHAEVQQLPEHTEFLATGGSLYFLRHKDVVEGSDSIKIEVRDKVTGLVLASKEMRNGADYELDEGQGRILFWLPVAMIAKSESIVSTSLIDGNPVYVVADYQYLVQDKLRQSSAGARVAQGVGDNVVVGGTYVRETQDDGQNYALQGTDVTAHLGPDATVKAEYAQTESAGTGSFVSTDGGITFTQLLGGDLESGVAYGIRGDARLFNRLGLSSYYKWIENSFSSPETAAQQGKESAGLELTFDLTPVTRLTARQDIQRLINNGNLQTQAQVGASETSTTLIQVVHETERLTLTGAYQIQQVKEKIGDIVSSSNQVSRILAGKADYALNGWVNLYLGQQFDVLNKGNNITTLGAQARLIGNLTAKIEESFSNEGTATTFGLRDNITDNLAFSTDFTIARTSGGVTDQTAAFAAEQRINDALSTTASVALTNSSTGLATTTTSLSTRAQLNESSSVDVTVGKTSNSSGEELTTAAVTADTALGGPDAGVKTTVAVDQGSDGSTTRSITLDANQKINAQADTNTRVAVSEDASGIKTSTVTFTDRGKLNDELLAVSERSFGSSTDGNENANKYGLVRDKDGRKVEGSVTRQLDESKTAGVSQSNIFGLSGDINDRWALSLSFEKGEVQNLDGTHTHRRAFAAGSGYVWKDPGTAMERLKDSTKVEFRTDTGARAAQQFVFYNALEGKVNDNLSLSAKVDYAKTWSTQSKQTQARHKEIILGAAYRPVSLDNLNLITQYTFKENQGPVAQSSAAFSDVERTRTQVFAAQAIYDVNENWQLAEKFALRVNDEKVTGFEFNRTHTWLMIHRINYRLDRNWTISGEYRSLNQVEAKDTKQGLLLEAARSINDFTQLGVGWNFTHFNDDMTNLNFTSQGPFLRMTGKVYDRTPEEKARARAQWLDQQVHEWAWTMVKRELSKPESKVTGELNRLFVMAQGAQKEGRLEESRQAYKDIIMAGQMMFDEAEEYIRRQITFEEKLQEYNKTAQDYFGTGEYLKARKLWEKIVDDAQKRMLQ